MYESLMGVVQNVFRGCTPRLPPTTRILVWRVRLWLKKIMSQRILLRKEIKNAYIEATSAINTDRRRHLQLPERVVKFKICDDVDDGGYHSKISDN